MTGIIGAMEEEVNQLILLMSDRREETVASMVFHVGKLWGKDCTVVKSGIGKVNGAICAQILVDMYSVDKIINTGIAGAVSDDLGIGDVVISADTVHHDVDVSLFGHAPGQIPRMDTLAFQTDEALAMIALRANRRANPDIQTFMGRVVSGDRFISSPEEKERIKKQFLPLCVEMEGAAIAQTAYLNRVSCVIIRGISDKADNSAAMDYGAFEKQAIAHTLRLLEEMFREM